eukprot:13566823-Heterocapsa_arctica.AAC.1
MRLGEKVVQKVNAEREESLGMIHLFLKVLKAILKLGGKRVIAAFEWPSGALGWSLDDCRELSRLLPV